MTVDEILDAMPDEDAATGRDYLVIDPVARTITVPESEKTFGVTGDDIADRKYFICPRYVGDNLDLASMFIRVNYRNAGGDEDGYLVDDVTVSGNYVTFSWRLWPKVTEYKGAIQFGICADLPNTTDRRYPDWNTTMASGEVLEGLHPYDGDVEEETRDVVTQLRDTVTAQTGNVEAVGAAQVQAVHAAAITATAEAQAQIVAKGAATLSTIPADYTAMAKKVEHLGNGKADAYMVTTKEAAASHEIHAQAGVLQLELQGVTYQAGTGDPSPDNVRQITGIGSYDAVVVLDGTEDWVAATNYAANTARLENAFSGGLCKAGTCSHFSPLTTATLTDGTRGAYMLETAKLFINYGTVADLKTYLAEQYAAGTPVTIWYQKATHDEADPYYVRAWTEDAAGGYRSIAANVGPVPLFDGDKVEFCARSGCDKKIVLDGTEEWTDYSGMYFVVHGVTKAAKPYAGYCSHLQYKYDYTGLCMFVGDNVLYCGTELRNKYGGNVESWKAYLAAQYAAGTPVTLWYYSIEYAPEKELQVCKVTRDKRRIVLTGKETLGVNVHGNGMQYMVCVSKGTKTAEPPVCSHYIGKTWADQTGHVHVINGNIVMSDSRFTDKDTAVAIVTEQYNAGTPITIVCKLEKPEVYAFDPAALRSLNSLPETVQASGLLSVTYPQDTTYTIQRLMAAVQALGGTI